MPIDLDIKFELFTKSCVVCDKPCWVYAIIGQSSSGIAKTLTVRDGLNNSAPAKLIVFGVVYDEPIIILKHLIRFKRGLYLSLEALMDYAMVQYKPDH